MEILIEAPGNAWVNWDKSKVKDGVYSQLVWEYDEEALHWATTIASVMEEVETGLFANCGSDLIGKASYAIAKTWTH